MSDEPRWRVLDTRDGYDRWAPSYDEEGNPLLALEEPEADRALGNVAGLEVLDAGTGTGRHALRLAERGAHVTAVDFSDEMLAKARAKPGANRVRFATWTSHDRSRSPMRRSIACSQRLSSNTYRTSWRSCASSAA